MKFGKRLQSQIDEMMPDWKDKFLSYKRLKKRLKLISAPDCFVAAAFGGTSPSRASSEEEVSSAVDVAVEELRKKSGKPEAITEDAKPKVAGDLQGLWEKFAGDEELLEGVFKDQVLHKEELETRDQETTCKVTESKVENAENKTTCRSSESIAEDGDLPRRRIYVDIEGKVGEFEFTQLLDVELEKFNDFFMEKEEEYVIRLQELKDRTEKIKERRNANDENSGQELINIWKAVVTLYGEMVLLENYSSLNYTGLVKILKKHDKRMGSSLRLNFIESVLHQPFFTTELLSKLVRECEQNLRSIFPSTSGNSEIAVAEDDPKENLDSIHRSILAALRTIQDLSKGSSTYGALSLPPRIIPDVAEGADAAVPVQD